MIYRSIKLLVSMFILLIGVSRLSITLAAPTFQATTPPPRVITPTVTITSTRQIGLLQCYEAYTTQPTDTLSKIAQRFYGAAVHFQVIIEATNAMALSDKSFTPITDTNRMKVGQKLCIINTADLPIIVRTPTITIPLPPLTVVTQISLPTPPPVFNQPIAPSLKVGEQIIEVPEDKAALTVENLSPVDLVFDLIGPSEQSYVIGTGQKWPMIIPPGSYSFNIHAATGEVDDLPIAPGSFNSQLKQVTELIVFARSVEIKTRELGINSTATPLPLINTPTVPIVSTLSPTTTNTPLPIVSTLAAPNTPTPILLATNTPTPTQPAPRPITSTPTLRPTTPVTPTLQPTATLTPTLRPTATITPTATPQPTVTNTPNPTQTPSPQPTIASNKKLAPPVGQGRLYFQNFYRETANFDLNNQPIQVEVEMIKMIDLAPTTYTFKVNISRGSGQGQIDLAANTSWLIRLDPNGGLGWVQVYP